MTRKVLPMHRTGCWSKEMTKSTTSWQSWYVALLQSKNGILLKNEAGGGLRDRYLSEGLAVQMMSQTSIYTCVCIQHRYLRMLKKYIKRSYGPVLRDYYCRLGMFSSILSTPYLYVFPPFLPILCNRRQNFGQKSLLESKRTTKKNSE